MIDIPQWLWKERGREPYTKVEAYVWIMDYLSKNNGDSILPSSRKIGKTWGWDHRRVSRFIKHLGLSMDQEWTKNGPRKANDPVNISPTMDQKRTTNAPRKSPKRPPKSEQLKTIQSKFKEFKKKHPTLNIEEEYEGFLNYMDAKGVLYKNYEAAFRNRLILAEKWQKPWEKKNNGKTADDYLREDGIID